MISKLARDDFEDLRAQGLNPTLEDFDRLNQIALRLTDGKETTCANFPRVGWAGDVPFYQPTLAAFAWYHGYAARLASDEETANTLWWFALAHARMRRFFDALHTRDEIDTAVRAWVELLPVTREEVARAARYAVTGFDDAVAAKGTEGKAKYRADRSAAADASRSSSSPRARSSSARRRLSWARRRRAWTRSARRRRSSWGKPCCTARRSSARTTTSRCARSCCGSGERKENLKEGNRNDADRENEKTDGELAFRPRPVERTVAAFRAPCPVRARSAPVALLSL